jgi:hypothetical protein
VDSNNGAGSGRRVPHFSAAAVLEQQLTPSNRVPDLDLEAGFHSREIVRHDGDALHRLSVGDRLGRLPRDGEVQTLLDLVDAHAFSRMMSGVFCALMRR